MQQPIDSVEANLEAHAKHFLDNLAQDLNTAALIDLSRQDPATAYAAVQEALKMVLAKKRLSEFLIRAMNPTVESGPILH